MGHQRIALIVMRLRKVNPNIIVQNRINALEEYLLPRLRGQLRGIASVLDEREREDTFRLKKIKGKKAVQKRKAQAAAAAAATATESAE